MQAKSLWLRIAFAVECLATLLLLSGCINPGIRRDVDVLVLDSETNRPIENATVTVRPGPRILHVPIPSEDAVTKTNDAGQATIAAPRYLFPVWIDWRVEADGYEVAIDSSDGGRVPRKLLAQGSWLAWRQQATVKLFREPGPSVSLLVPDGYRGPLFVDVVPDETPSSSPIAEIPPRHFAFRAAPNGYVRVAAYPILAHKSYMPRPRWEEHISIIEVGGREVRPPVEPVGQAEFSANAMLRWVATQEESDTRARHLFYLGDLDGERAFDEKIGKGDDRQAKIKELFDNAEAATFSPR